MRRKLDRALAVAAWAALAAPLLLVVWRDVRAESDHLPGAAALLSLYIAIPLVGWLIARGRLRRRASFRP